MIKPTVGRVVWFWPHASWPTPDFLVIDPKQPCNASIAYVWSDRMVNLTVSDHYGNTFNFTSVDLLQEGDTRPADGRFAEWMPYQVGQAKQHGVSAGGLVPDVNSASGQRIGAPISGGGITGAVMLGNPNIAGNR